MRTKIRNNIAKYLLILCVLVIFWTELDYIISLKGIYPIIVALGVFYVINFIEDILK